MKVALDYHESGFSDWMGIKSLSRLPWDCVFNYTGNETILCLSFAFLLHRRIMHSFYQHSSH